MLCLCEESFIDTLFLVLEILRGGTLCPPPPPPPPLPSQQWLHKPKKLLVNRVKLYGLRYHQKTVGRVTLESKFDDYPI